MNMRKLAEIFGFDSKKLWYYRDLALGTVASIATLWAIVALGFEKGEFDRRVGIICVGIVVVCCALSPNWHLILGVAAGVAAIQGWFAVAFSGDSRSWWVAVPATVIAVGLFRIFGKRSIRGDPGSSPCEPNDARNGR